MIKINKRALDISGICILLFLNVLSTVWNPLGILIGVCVYIVVYAQLFSGNTKRAFLTFIICMASSFEVNSFVYYNEASRNLYSMLLLPYVSVYPFYLTIYLFTFLLYYKYQKMFHNKLRTHRNIKSLATYIPIMIISGFVMGVLTYLVNDNGIAGLNWYLGDFFRVTFQSLAMMCIIISSAILFVCDDDCYITYSKTFETFLVSSLIVGLFTGLLGWHGYYGSNPNILLMPLCVSIAPIVAIFPLYEKKKANVFYLILTILFIIESFFYGSLMGSKFYMVLGLLIFVYYFKAAQRSKVLDVMVITLGVLGIIISYSSIFESTSIDTYVGWKLTQLIDMFKFSGRTFLEWYENIAVSPRYRLEEFINIFLEYLKKPVYIIFGKGNAGTITHLWGNLNWNVTLGNFPEEQVASRVYRSMHESVNILFLRHGFIGLAFFIKMMKEEIRLMFKSRWALAGFIWIFFYWGAYQSWWIGAVMLVMSLYEGSRIEGDLRQ